MKTQLFSKCMLFKQFISACFSFFFFLIIIIQTVITDLPMKKQAFLWWRMLDFSNNHISPPISVNSVSYIRYTVYYMLIFRMHRIPRCLTKCIMPPRSHCAGYCIPQRMRMTFNSRVMNKPIADCGSLQELF